MALTSAHQGYYYQDIFGAYLLAKEIANGRLDTQFKFDKKSSDGDLFDDLVELNNGNAYRLQFKYSHEGRRLCKNDLSSGSNYKIALSDLFFSWKKLAKSTTEFRLCLSWDGPTKQDPLNSILIEHKNIPLKIPGTVRYKINVDSLWPKDSAPLSSWRKFRKAAKNISREEFVQFCTQFIIEVNLPKSGLDLKKPGPIEKALFRQIELIGIGQYPNDHLSQREVASFLIDFVHSQRRNPKQNSGEYITSANAASYAKINTHFGAIEQKFPIHHEHLVSTTGSVELIIKKLKTDSKIILTGAPGSGKSWLIENLEKEIENNFHVVKHYCYTGLDDKLQSERIKVNTLYGNLIDQLIDEFEEIVQYKSNRFASNLPELNSLLGEIEENTLILVDGLDHVWRVYEKNKDSLKREQIKILEALEKINVSNPKVKLLVLSQPIEELKQLSGFEVIEIKPWSFKEIGDLMETHHLDDIELKDGKLLSTYIRDKSDGNALYASYIIKWLLQSENKSQIEDTLGKIPPYAFNLNPYYKYLLGQLTRPDIGVPAALCGASFSLSENDLKEITGLGQIVNEQLSTLLPILKHNQAFGGFKIYHESFKRFFVEEYISSGVKVSKVIYEPLGNWLLEKDFFRFRKASLYLLPLLERLEWFQEIVRFIQPDFIQNSLFYGHPLLIIKNNHQVQTRALKATTDFKKIVILSEQKKVLAGLHDFNTLAGEEYIKTLGLIHGDGMLYDFLHNEGRLLFDKKTTYQLLKNMAYSGKMVNWSIIPKEKLMYQHDFDAIVVQCLATGAYDKLETYAERFAPNQEENIDWRNILKGETRRWIQFTGTRNWLKNYPHLDKLVDIPQVKGSIEEFEELIRELISFDKVESEKRIPIINKLKLQAKALGKEGKQKEVIDLLNLLSEINWFYNWLQFLIMVFLQKGESWLNFEELESAFYLLVRDTSKSKGSPRLYDLYPFYGMIGESFVEGLQLCQTSEQRKKCFSILQKLSDETTYSLKGEYTGILTPESLLDLLIKFQTPDEAISAFEEELVHAERERVHADIALMYFQLSGTYKVAGKEKKAKDYFNKGILLLTAYGYHKDRTLSELLESCQAYLYLFPEEMDSIMEELYLLSYSVAIHTDQRSTVTYPTEWFEHYFDLAPKKALAFLASNLLDSQFPHFYEEDQLFYVLKRLRGKVSPLAEFLLLITFPNAASEKFYYTFLDVLEKIPGRYQKLAQKWLNIFTRNAGNDRFDRELSKDLVDSLFDVLRDPEIKKIKTKQSAIEVEQNVNKKSETSELEITTPEKELGIGNNNAQSSDQETLLSLSTLEEQKNFILQLFRQNRLYSNAFPWLDDCFPEGTEIWIFTQVACFVNRMDGWNHIMNDPLPLVKVFEVDPEKSTNYLFELLSRSLSDEVYPQKISSNLLNALIACGLPKSQVKELWKQIYELIKERIPYPYKYDFEKEVDNSLYRFSEEELLVCILLSRIKGMSTERVHRVLFGIEILITDDPNLLIKPLEWLFSHEDKMLPLHIGIFLQTIHDTVVKEKLSSRLLDIISDLYPTRYFWADCLIEKITGRKSSIIFRPNVPVFIPGSQQDLRFLRIRHPRYTMLEKYGIDLSLVAKEPDLRMEKEQDLLERFHNNLYGATVLNIKHGAFLYEIFQSQYYSKLQELNAVDERIIQDILPLSIDILIAQIHARVPRPLGFLIPSELEKEQGVKKIHTIEEWVILGSSELEYKKTSDYKLLNFEANQVVFFTSDQDLANSYYSKYRLKFDYYKTFRADFELESTPVIHYLAYDFFERINIFWLSPRICFELEIRTSFSPHEGLRGLNKQGEEVLKFDSWADSYLYGDDVSSELPMLSGCRLLIRKDYFNKMMELFPEMNAQRYVKVNNFGK